MYDSDEEDFDFESESTQSLPSEGGGFIEEPGNFWEISHQSLDQSDVLRMADQDIQRVRDLLMLSEDLSTRLLRINDWQVTDSVEKYLTDPEKWTERCGLVESEPDTMKTKISGNCCICFEKVPAKRSKLFPCKHYLCTECFPRYIEECLKNGTNIAHGQFIKCPGYNCKLLYGDSLVQHEVEGNEQLVALSRQRIIRYYVGSHKSTLRWCISPDCLRIIQLTGTLPRNISKYSMMPAVHCTCGTLFCFQCQQSPPHLPLPCELLQKWNQKCMEDAATASWLVKNTKICPKCKSSTEKNAGCNHMTCQNCGYQYCWVCLGIWSRHSDNFVCHIYKGKSSGEIKNAGEEVEFYVFHYNRYINHKKASVFQDTTLRARFKEQQDAYQSALGSSWLHFEWIFETINALVYTRGILQYNYALMYFLEQNTLSQLFEENIKDLEVVVELLSDLLENQINPTNAFQLKTTVINKTGYMKSRTKTLISNTLVDLLDDKWRFSSLVE